MKRFFSILLVTALLIGLTPLVASVAQAEEYATVISDNGYGVRLREGPSKTYNVIKVYEVGTTVIVQQKGLEWSQLLIGDTVGWMMNQYLNFGSVGNSVSNGSITGVGNATVTSDNGLRVWLRTRPSGTRIRLYSPGTAVTVLQRGDTWSQISIGGTIGYMMSRYLAFETISVPASGSKQVTAVSVNYPDPLAGDTLEAKVTPEDATVTYSWKVDGVEQSTDETLVVLARYAGAKIQLTVKGIGVYTGTATYTTSEVVTAKWISGVQLSKSEPYVGDTLTAILKPSSAKVIYSWRVGGIEVGTEASYTVQESDIGKLIQLKVTGTDGFSGSAACSATANVLSNKVVNAAIINNTQPIPGDVLSYTVQPTGATTSCVWKADGEKVATVASYKVQQSDIGKVITVTVTGTGDYSGSAIGSTAKVTSARLASVKIGNTSPVDGQTIYAVPSPAAATASYTWYANGVEIETNSTPDFEVPEEAVGKTLTVTAVGTGAYTGTATSAATNKVVSSKKITSVTLSNTTPVVGDTIGVTIKPSTANSSAAKEQHSYVWTIGNKTVSGMGMSTYKVEAADVGLTIRVRVVGVSPYSGDVYSGYTDAVVSASKLTGVSLKNNDTGVNAASVSPEVGHTLKAVVSPSQAQVNGAVKYTWKVAGEVVTGATSDTFVVPKDAVGKQISVTVQGTGNYKGDGKTTYTATSAKAVQYKPLTLSLKIAAPKAGNIPTYNLSVDKQYSAKVVWLDETGNTAKLDEAGAFLPGSVYIAKVTVTPASGYTMMGATANASGATVTIKGNVVTCSYPATSSQQVNDYYITCISRPVPGQTQAVSFTDTQYDGTIEWDNGNFDSKGNIVFTAKITLTSKDGYTFKDVPANVFEVAGADSVTSQAGEDSTLSLTAVYKVTPTVVISADSTQVALDGVNRRVVSLSAELTNYYEPAVSIEWSVTGATTDATSMTSADQIGKLIVGANETVDRDLIVHAKAVASDGYQCTGTLSVHLISGSVESNAISVVFNKAPVSAQYGDSVQLEATAVNSVLGVIWSVFPNDVSTINDATGLLNISESETAKQLVVTATSIEDPSKSSNFLISLRPKVSMAISPEAITLNVYQQVLFTAEITGTDTVPDVKWSMSGNSSTETTITPSGLDCSLNLAYDEAADQIKLQAVTEDGLSATAVVTVNKTYLLNTLDVNEVAAVALEESAELTEEAEDEEDADAVMAEKDETTEALETAENGENVDSAESTEPTIYIESVSTTQASAQVSDEDSAKDEEGNISLELTVEDDPVNSDEIATVGTDEIKLTESQDEAEENVGMIVITNEDGTVDFTDSLDQPNEENEKNGHDEAQEAAAVTEAEVSEAELIALEEEKDDLDSDENIGESQENDRNITVSFVKKVDLLERSASGVFEVNVSGSEEGVLWRVYHGGSNEEGERFSAIMSNGLSATLTIGADETSSKLTVAAISKEDNTILARWIITITNPTGTKTTSDGTEAVSLIDETDDSAVEGMSQTSASSENMSTDENEAKMAEEALSEENKELTEEEQKEQDTLNMF